ncbi:ABC transporter substrate-binding protein [Thalassobaculum salexigens]|uniref:ABC transporter substrate-binding protein n=1 Tax=Thalassobaculum salexigens TaxID=455360 RepID=UPI00248F304F|nr:ABC transporter substrate-binding protein [Thalassobaculum salexigens]
MAPRIVSLLPSATEVVTALGMGEHLVGRSHECDYPAEVVDVPVMTRPRINPAKPSRGLHRQVSKLITKALSVFEVDADALKAAKPDIILTQHQCTACAVSEADLNAALATWTGSQPVVVSVAPETLDQVWRSFGTMADAFDLRWAGNELAERARERVEIIAMRGAALDPKPTIACVEWIDPPMIAGNWVPELVTAAGGVPVMAKKGQHSEFTTLSKLAKSDPDAMIFMPCGFDLARTLEEAAPFIARPTIAAMRAVRQKKLWAVDGNAYFNRPGPRLVTSLEILAEILNPGAFNFSREGTAWASVAGSS